MAKTYALRGLTGERFKRMQTRLRNEGKRHLRALVVRIYGERGGCCEKCLAALPLTELTPHHRHYRNQWEEQPEDVVLLCVDCHWELHERHRQDALTKGDAPFVDPLWVDDHGDIISGRKSPRVPGGN